MDECGSGERKIGNPQRLNRFASVYNDPVNWIDPDGKEPMPKYTVKVVHPMPFEFSLQVNGFTPFGMTETGPMNPMPVGGTSLSDDFMRHWNECTEARTAATNKMATDEKCQDFLQQILDYGSATPPDAGGSGHTPTYSINSVAEALNRVFAGFGNDSHSFFDTHQTTNAITNGGTIYLGDNFFGENSRQQMQTIIHESLHLLVSVVTFNGDLELYGAGLLDVPMAKAAGVYRKDWDNLAGQDKILKASGAFTKELRKHCK